MNKVNLPDFYSPGHLSTIVPYCNFAPKWLLLGGPADANEAQTARAFWPQCRVVAWEPNPEAYRWQVENVHEWGEPDSGMLLCPLALADTDGELTTLAYQPGRLRNASRESVAFDGLDDVRTAMVRTMRLDTADVELGPFSDAVLWLDVEGSELDALKGGAGLLARGAVRLVNVEVQSHRTEQNRQLTKLLAASGFTKAHRWNHSPACEDQVWVLTRARR